MKQLIATVAFAVIAATSSAVSAQSSDQEPRAATVTTPAAALTEGEVRKIDKDAKKLTIRHGAIQNLEMPPMTMVFQVTEPAMLDQVKVGDKIRFVADKAGGTFMVTQIEQAK